MSRLNRTVNKALRTANKLSGQEKNMLSKVKGPEKAQMKAQLQLQKRQQMIQFVSNMLKITHDTRMGIVNNTR